MSNPGSPKCTCSTPDPCLCTLNVTAGNNSPVDIPLKRYKGKIYLHDKEGSGVKITSTLVSKCSIAPAKCPAGILYEISDFKVIKDISPSTPLSASLKYTRKLTAPNPVDFFNAVLFGDIRLIPSTDYQLNFGECRGGAPEQQSFISTSGKRQTRPLGKTVHSNTIKVFPKYSSTLAFDLEIEKKEQTEKKSTNLLLTTLTERIAAKGALTFDLAGNTKSYDSVQLTEKFTNAKDDLEQLSQAEQALGTVNNIFGMTSSGQATILDCQIRPPKISVNGNCDLELAKDHTPYFSRSITLGFAPLVGFTLKLNLLQALATYLGVGVFTEYIQQKAKELEEDFKKEKNSAYAGAKLELIFDTDLNLGYKVASKKIDYKEKETKLTFDATKVAIKVTAETNVRAGVKYMLLEGCLEIGAKAIAEAFFELQQNSNNQLEGVFYHNGVIANVYVEASFGKEDDFASTIEQTDSSKFSSSPKKKTDKATASQKEKITPNTWIIYKKLPREQSTYKIRLA